MTERQDLILRVCCAIAVAEKEGTIGIRQGLDHMLTALLGLNEKSAPARTEVELIEVTASKPQGFTIQ